ncbi:hypothetical protein GCM10028803_29170 [Larkinella knui]|uniref:DUF4403 family protein n=1 Tax=Larkinella knui TaxID=2025310 RepID=A0A3P1CXJ7_9BACT|nr:DUF4403 family protein [Larkinella knui]RRB17949.1 DUF4403 family protein [Larkinella knui]
MTSATFTRLLVGLAILVAMTHCQQAQPRPPKAEGFDAAIPADTSYLAGPITFTLNELQKKINQELGTILVGKGSENGKRAGVFPFQVVRSGPVRIQYASNQLKFSAPLGLYLKKPFSSASVSERKPFCSLHVNFQSPLTVTPNWRLASKVQFTNYEWIEEPEIRLLGKEISLTNFAKKILDNSQSIIESAIDLAIYKELRLDRMVEPIWQSIQKPLLIDRQFGLWLLPKPLAVEASPIDGNAVKITTHLRVAFSTKTVLQPQKPAYSEVKLPVLQKRDTLSQTSDLRLLSFIPYADINRMLARTLAREKKKLLLGALTIQKATVYGGQRALIVKTDVSGLLNGTLYLRGRPTFDTLTNTLHIQDLDFDAGTVSELSRVSNSLIHNGMIKVMEQFLTISLGGDIEKLPQTISESFQKGEAGKKTNLAIQSFQFTPQKIAIRPDGIQALIYVQSKVAVQVKKL